MAEFPYTPTPAKLEPFLTKIQSIGIPPKVTVKYLKSIGFTSSNDRYLVPIFKVLGFLDSSGSPTERWKQYRNKSRSTGVLALAIRDGYADLFATYSDAYRKDDEALRNFFTSKTDVGEVTVTRMLRTFKALVALADFLTDEQAAPKETLAASASPTVLPAATGLGQPGLTVNVNIQLTLPETKDSSVYDKIFESMKKHLMS